jgi:hypothetical protein
MRDNEFRAEHPHLSEWKEVCLNQKLKLMNSSVGNLPIHTTLSLQMLPVLKSTSQAGRCAFR